jgi:hypothetical protein
MTRPAAARHNQRTLIAKERFRWCRPQDPYPLNSGEATRVMPKEHMGSAARYRNHEQELADAHRMA